MWLKAKETEETDTEKASKRTLSSVISFGQTISKVKKNFHSL